MMRHRLARSCQPVPSGTGHRADWNEGWNTLRAASRPSGSTECNHPGRYHSPRLCACQEAGIALEPLLQKAGLTVRQAEDLAVRLPVRAQIRFVELASTALEDEFLGFHLAQSFDLREIGRQRSRKSPKCGRASLSFSRCLIRTLKRDPSLPTHTR